MTVWHGAAICPLDNFMFIAIDNIIYKLAHTILHCKMHEKDRQTLNICLHVTITQFDLPINNITNGLLFLIYVVDNNTSIIII